jgi:heat shock protein HtpX
MKSTPFILGRAALAVVLMIGFYLLALSIAGALLFLVYAAIVYGNRVPVKLILFCVIGGFGILWSVLPRFDKFVPPGPQLRRDQHPRLFDEIESIAKATGQSPPVEVFLVADVNAWVAQRGGIMGMGSRRVMGLGLPLLRALTRSQLRAVLAHEFGHYYGGDTKIGPWIYKTRGAIGRTLASLRGGVLQFPFLLYGKMFLRVTHAVSRRQEFVADELAARVAGSTPLIAGLQAVHRVAPAFDAYWRNECVPVLNSGYRPPLVEGFQKFVQANNVIEAMSKHLDEELKSGKTDPYDTHPPLKERIAAIQHLPAGHVDADDPPAITLLNQIPALEQELIISLAGPVAAGKLKPINWPDVCTQVYMPQWTSLVKANVAGLKGVTPESLPKWAADMRSFEGRFPRASGHSLAAAVVGAALLLLLIRKGGQPDATPGKEVSVTLGGVQVEPFGLLQSLADGKITAAGWQQTCAELGIAGVDLAAE